MKYIYIITIVLFLTACSRSNVKDYIPPEYEKIADNITALTARKIEDETGLKLIGVGGGMMDKVRMMSMSFACYQEASLEQSRELLVYCVNEYLWAINESELLKPYLVHYPFTAKDVEIRLFFHTPTGKNVPLGALSAVSEVEGVLHYRIHQTGPMSLKEIHEESFDEAVKIVEKSKPEVLIRHNCSKKCAV